MEQGRARIESLSAITLTVSELARSVRFYEALGFERKSGGASDGFASFALGGENDAKPSFLNLMAGPPAAPGGPAGGWGRVIFHVSDVDAFYRQALGAGFAPSFAPADAPWGERYFHLLDPDGHELSFARPLAED
ncbi:glyoxalase [Burkholderia sp. WAC0059]|uniref:VOC family protein n=1 Tax=Burkholderia sp. WAC0059 TaxID=2066022 RepID=UPI000C7F3987|nr:VOC family protein [Burkholderia sp. WAC0059]PLZ04225.1 glyoxalase [Burkholderia sp. WAC0059]